MLVGRCRRLLINKRLTMKRKGNLINKLCSLDNIIYADITARKNKKKSRKYINIHDKHLLEEDIKI